MTQIATEPARSGPITDDTLVTMIAVTRDLAAGRCTQEGAALLLQNLGPCLEELADYRARAKASLELEPDASNVIFLPRNWPES